MLLSGIKRYYDVTLTKKNVLASYFKKANGRTRHICKFFPAVDSVVSTCTQVDKRINSTNKRHCAEN